MKIIIIGCPGAGKSQLAKRISKHLSYPLLHLDKVYHTGGKNHIQRDELLSIMNKFTDDNKDWIIDGNYISTLEFRVKLADTVILLNIPSEICLSNAYKRSNNALAGIKRDDMNENFDETLTDEFIEFIRNFEIDTLPTIINTLNNYKDKKVYIINNYDELEIFYHDFYD